MTFQMRNLHFIVSNRFFNLCRFDTKTKEWSRLPVTINNRYYCSATVMNGCIYVAGGRENDRKELKSVEKYDPKVNRWKNLAAMNESRSNFALVNSGGFLYAIGSAYSVERYNPLNNEWITVSKLTKFQISFFSLISHFPPLSAQVGSFTDCRLITSAIYIDDKLFLMKDTAENVTFGTLTLNDHEIGSFEQLLNPMARRKAKASCCKIFGTCLRIPFTPILRCGYSIWRSCCRRYHTVETLPDPPCVQKSCRLLGINTAT